jgi:predicted nucleic acid-binding protein
MRRAFVDTDICADLLLRREPHYEHAALLFTRADEKKVMLCISSLTFANLDYLLKQKHSRTEARQILMKFKLLAETLNVDDKIITLALSSDFADFEDAIQYYCAVENGIQILLTRNLPDYKKAEISVMTAASFLAME